MEPKVVNLFVFDGMADWEPSYAIAGINNPQFQKQPGRYVVKTAGLTSKPIRTVGGLRIIPDSVLSDVEPDKSAMLIVPGGSVWDEQPDIVAAAVDKAGELLEAGVAVAAICGATAGFARGGLLDGRKHTSNAREYLAATGYAGSDFYVDAPAVTGDNVITAPGTAALEFAYHIFKRLNVHTDQVLDAWLGLYKTGEPRYFYALMEAAGGM